MDNALTESVRGGVAGVLDVDELRRREVAAHIRRERRMTNLVLRARLVLLLTFLVGWYWASGRVVDSLFVSDPIAVVLALWAIILNGTLAYHLQFTLFETLAGYLIGACGGLVAAWIVALSPTLQKVLHPFIMGVYSIPKIALAPLIIMWFGLGITPKIVIAAIFVFFVVFMNSLAGIRSVSPSLISVARVMGANNAQLMMKVIFPSAIPFIIMALRITVPDAMIGSIVGEFFAGNRGVGYLINAASSQYNTAGVFAGIIALLAIVLVMDLLVSVLERWLTKGRSARAGTAGA